MCGLAGIIRPSTAAVELREIESMLDRMRFRGPDDSGVHLGPGLGLGHVRLSIQDLSPLAAQPMKSRCGRFMIVYNGELYNHDVMRDELTAEGLSLQSTGDTEALVEYAAAFGIDRTLERIEGMFAFALWDDQEKTVTLARDRHGIKPLYYELSPDRELRFASEMKVLLDRQHAPDLVTLMAITCGLGGTWGEPTVFQGINSVRAGEMIVLRDGQILRKQRYFKLEQFIDPEFNAYLDTRSPGQVVDLVGEALQASVSGTLLSDAPVCAFVSGGVDSSLIAAMAMKEYSNLALYHANVVGDSELGNAQALAKALGLELRTVDVTDQDVVDCTPLATYHYEMPIGYHHGGCVPFLRVSELAGADGMKVALTGEGSDEYFLGYPHLSIRSLVLRYKKFMGFMQYLFHKLPGVGPVLWPLEESNSATHLKRLVFRYELEVRREPARESFAFLSNSREQDLQAQVLDLLHGNLCTLLHRNDRLGMRASLESRFPFLGHDLARLALNLPSRFKVRLTRRFYDWRHPFITDKWAVRSVADRLMPSALSNMKKFGLRSTFYQRADVDRGFYENGFMAEHFQLTRSALDHMCRTMSPFWKHQVYSLEVWGQLFCMGWSLEETREHGRRHVTVRPE